MSNEDTRPLGRVVTFYSYKGGTGRTMALANTAWLLAANGYRVLAIDWDLESPGLHRYFHPFLKDKELRSSEGIFDLIRRYAEATVQQGGGPGKLAQLAHIQEYAVSLDWEFPSGGVIDFVAAGRQDAAYAPTVSTFDWDSFWSRLRGGVFIEALRNDMRDNYDFVLVDSRTGTSDTAGICTVQLPDTVVNCFTLNKQSIDGAAAITASIQRQRRRPITVYPVPTRIEDGEKLKLDRGRSYARRSFVSHMDFVGDEDPESYWDAIEVPYIPYYAYEEVLATFGDRPRQENSLLARYQRLAARIAGHECAAPVINESERARILRKFEQSTPADPLTILVAYAPLDRIWAEWLRDRLGRSGQNVRTYCIQTSAPSLEGIDRVIVLYSRDFAAYEEGERLSRAATERVASGEPHFLVTVRVDASSVPQHVSARALVDVMGVNEERALEMLFSALGLDLEELPEVDGRSRPEIRYPAVTAPYWNVQLVRNSRFSGRGAVLEEIRDRLLAGGADGGRLVLTGLPGVGKTQIALEYVYRFAASYDVVWWISASQPARARIALADLAERLELKSEGTVEAQLAAVLETLRQGLAVGRWLVVFDNADEPSDFQDLLPSGPGHLIITSRNPQWSDSRTPNLDINVFQRDESIELLGRRVRDIERADAGLLAGRLGDLPLAVEQAGGWLSSTGMAVDDYVRLLDQSTAQAMDESAPADYRETITSTVRVAYDELCGRNLAAARLLELFALMAPEAIPYRLISNKRLTEFLTGFDHRLYDPMLQATLIREIGRYALARVDSGTGGVVVHRLTQEIVRSQLSADEQAERRAEIHAILAATERGNPGITENWRTYEALRPHLQPSGALASESPEVRQLVIDMARYLRHRSDSASGEELARAALDEWLPRFGPDDLSTLRLSYELAVAVREQGRESEAYEINRDSLERLRLVAGDEHPYTLITASSHGADLRNRGDYHEARELDEQTVATIRVVLGDDNAYTLNAVNNLAVSLRMVGEFTAAARLDRETLERRRKTLGTDDSATLVSATNYGADLREAGDLAPSRNTLETGYGNYRRVLGDDDPRTLRAGKSYAVTLRRLGEINDAAGLITEITTRSDAVLGHRHPTTVAFRLELACAQWALGQYDDARKTGEEVYSVYRQVRDYPHPVTLAAGNDLSIFRRWAGDVEGARRLAEKTAERLQAILGPRHPHTLAGMLTLANALYADGARAEARRRDEEAYSRLRKVLAENHPTVLAAAVNHAVSHRSEEPEQAEALRADVLQRLQSILGDEHPYTVAASEWRRIDVDIEPLPT